MQEILQTIRELTKINPQFREHANFINHTGSFQYLHKKNNGARKCTLSRRFSDMHCAPAKSVALHGGFKASLCAYYRESPYSQLILLLPENLTMECSLSRVRTQHRDACACNSLTLGVGQNNYVCDTLAAAGLAWLTELGHERTEAAWKLIFWSKEVETKITLVLQLDSSSVFRLQVLSETGGEEKLRLVLHLLKKDLEMSKLQAKIASQIEERQRFKQSC
eukprot:44933-Amphidinium_carterae.1